ncbi:MAG: hypothetical protein AAGG51_16160 [Cyanobacteria bacterium P01_G01_bin.54]
MKKLLSKPWVPWAFAMTGLATTVSASIICYWLNTSRLNLVNETRKLTDQVILLTQENQELENQNKQLSETVAILTQNQQSLESGMEVINTCVTYVDQTISISMRDLFNELASFSFKSLLKAGSDISQVALALIAFSSGDCQAFRETVQDVLDRSRSTDTRPDLILATHPEAQQDTLTIQSPMPNPATTMATPMPNSVASPLQ